MKKSILILTASIAFSGLSFGADDEHEHADGAHHATIMVPEDLTDLWSHINAYSKVVSDAAAKGDMVTLHKEQNNLAALIKALSGASGSLPADKKSRVDGMIKNVERSLGQLHGATDGNEVGSIGKVVKSMSGVITILKAQYPGEVTGGMAEVKDDIGPHEGMLATFSDSSGKTVGHLELKLHDDKGDLELWLAEDAAITKPFDLPADSKILVTFSDAKQPGATLSVRNNDKNEDEDGAATMRNGKTNYFIFPGESGVSADWLMGKQFKSNVTVSFTVGGNQLTTKSFLLIPHGHDGHEH